MKQIFNPAIDVDKYGNELSPFLPPKERMGCVSMDKKQANAFQVWAHSHGKKVVTRTIGGETLVFKVRKDRSKKEG